MEENKLYFSLDSDILRTLAYMVKKLEMNPDYNFQDDSDNIAKKSGNYLQLLLELAKEDKVRLLVVNTVWHETKHIQDVINFIKEYCYFPNVNFYNLDEREEKITLLVDAYCTPYVYKGKEFYSPFVKTYIPKNKSYEACADCYYVAESVYELAIPLTNNYKHLVYNIDRNIDVAARVQHINILNGYFEERKDGKIFSIHPWTISDFGPFLKRIDKFESPVSQNEKIKANKIMR